VQQQELFTSGAPSLALPDGLAYRARLLSPAEEEDARAHASRLVYRAFEMRGFVAKREVAYFGHDYAYDARALSPGPPFPDWLLPLRERAAAFAGERADDLVMAVVIHYPPGAGIGWHRDAPAFGLVVGLSLGGPARFQLRKGGPGGERLELLLGPGDAYVLARAARWQWQHHIPPSSVRAERYAITFRTMRTEAELRPHRARAGRGAR
jgi:alkylated DNA repair protein (DNA oxidative demethylase)